MKLRDQSHGTLVTTAILVLATLLTLAGCSETGIYDLVRAQSRAADFQVRDLAATAGDQQVTLSWQDPDDPRLDFIQVEFTPGAGVLTVPAGLETVTVTDLTNGTPYQFDLYAVSESGTMGASIGVSATPTVPALPDDSWAVGSATSRRRLIVDSRHRSEALTGFPLLVRLDASRVDYDEAAANGADLRFLDAGNTDELFYEVEAWNPSGESLVWVRVPEIAPGERDYLWMYWGGGETTTHASPADVWADYELVLHFSGDLTDSSPNGRDGSWTGNDDFGAGPVGRGARVGDSSGTASFIDVPGYSTDYNGESLDAYTIELWMQGDAPPSLAPAPNGPLMGHRLFNIGWDHDTQAFVGSYHFHHTTLGWTSVPAPGMEPGQWYYAAGVFDGTAGVARSFRDGEPDSQLTGMEGATGTIATYLRIGAGGDVSSVFDGRVDEVRITHRALSTEWIAAQYESMRDKLLLFGETERR